MQWRALPSNEAKRGKLEEYDLSVWPRSPFTGGGTLKVEYSGWSEREKIELASWSLL